MTFDPIDTQQLSQSSLMLLLHNIQTKPNTVKIRRSLIVSGKWDKQSLGPFEELQMKPSQCFYVLYSFLHLLVLAALLKVPLMKSLFHRGRGVSARVRRERADQLSVRLHRQRHLPHQRPFWTAASPARSVSEVFTAARAGEHEKTPPQTGHEHSRGNLISRCFSG